MNDHSPVNERNLGLVAAIGVGVAAIVGGGILALAGVAFAATGPSAVLAFALNGVIALLTALSFAEMSSKFPESGGTYTFARKVVSVEAAFTVGWVVWFASIVAAVLYALGFAHFGLAIIADLLRAFGGFDLEWLDSWLAKSATGVAITLLLAVRLATQSGGSGHWANVGKLIVFGVLIVCGLWSVSRQAPENLGQVMTPFFSAGMIGLVQAMGYSFIALQGFDLIAAVGGEIRQPEKNIPKAMVWSLIIALAIYLPLLLVIATVGAAPGESITAAAQRNPEGIVALAAGNYLGTFGYWLVMVAAVLSMLTALQANLFAASRISLAMSRDRTLPTMISGLSSNRRLPVVSIFLTAVIVGVLIFLLPDIAVAGAASSLIFLVTFAIAHWLAVLVRQRSVSRPPPFLAPLFPAVPIIGGLSCLGLAVFQAFAVPTAGVIAIAWLGCGGILFLGLFARRARIVDAGSTATDPELVALRGHLPLVLVPIANPSNAEEMMRLADALVPAGFGRVMVHNVVVASNNWRPDDDDQPIQRSQALMSEMLRASARVGIRAESLMTVASEPMEEIARVVKLHRCESVLIGLSKISEETDGASLEWLLSTIGADIVVFRSGGGSQLEDAKRILVPVVGRGGHEHLLARLLGSLTRASRREVTFLRVVPEETSDDEIRKSEKELARVAQDNVRAKSQWIVVRSNDVVGTIAERANESDVLILGAQRVARSQRLFGTFTRQIAARTECALIVMSGHR
jgi:amino acid transporter/nucleotide-binding universal stress UspA family protein